MLPLLLLHAEITWTRHLSASRKLCAIPFLALKLIKFTRFQCVNPCLLVCTPDMNTILIRNDSSLVKLKQAALKKWSCVFFNVFVPNANLRATLLPEPKGKSIASVRTVL